MINIDSNTCKKCILCVEVCPNKILKKNEFNEIVTRPERIELCFKCGQCMAICSSKAITVDNLSYEKDFFDLTGTGNLEMEKSFLELIRTRRAIRNFKDKPVPRELLEEIVEAITFAPPGFLPIKVKIIVVENPQLIKEALPYMIQLYEKLVNMMGKTISRYFIKKEVGKKGFKTLEEHLIPLLKSRMKSLKDGSENTITRDAPAMILFLADNNGEDNTEDTIIAATYGMLAAHSLGLGGSIMGLIPPAIDKNIKLREMFQIPDEQKVINSLIIGYPKYSYKRGIKRNLNSVKWI